MDSFGAAQAGARRSEPMRRQHLTSAQNFTDNPVQREMDKANARELRLKPHHDYMNQRDPRKSNGLSSIVGSYHIEGTGTGWKDELYQPNNMWMDIRESWETENVYEAMFDFGPAMKGMMLISADLEAMMVHSKIMDTVDFAEPEKEEDKRSAFLQGFLYAMKRKRASDQEEAAFAAHKSPNRWSSENRTGPPPTTYNALLRGSHRVPEWRDDFHDTYEQEALGVLGFKDVELCAFEFMCRCEPAPGVPVLEHVTGYKVRDQPRHKWVVPTPSQEPSSDRSDSLLDLARDSVAPGKKRQKTDWGSLREYSQRLDNVYEYDYGASQAVLDPPTTPDPPTIPRRSRDIDQEDSGPSRKRRRVD